MNIAQTKFFAERRDYGFTIGLFVFNTSEASTRQGKFWQAMPIKFEEIEGGMYNDRAREPTMNLTMGEAQALVDALWTAGIRPSEGTGSAGSLAATEKHLEDMRALVFNPLSKVPADKGGVKP